MVTVWPVVGHGCRAHTELESAGALFRYEHWAEGDVYDAYDPRAREVYWRLVNEAHYAKGMDALWLVCVRGAHVVCFEWIFRSCLS